MIVSGSDTGITTSPLLVISVLHCCARNAPRTERSLEESSNELQPMLLPQPLASSPVGSFMSQFEDQPMQNTFICIHADI